MRTCAVVNPTAGHGWARHHVSEIEARLQQTSTAVSIRTTLGPNSATTLTREALRLGYQRIVAVGGDGTLHEVVNGFFDDGAVVNPSAVLAFLPCGSSGDFRHALAIPNGLDALGQLGADYAAPVDVLRLTHGTESGQQETRYAINVISFGLSGPVVEMVGRSPQLLPTRVRYLGAALLALIGHRPAEVQLTLDDQSLDVSRVRLAAIANGTTFAAGVQIAPDARPDDGQFDLTVLDDAPLHHLLPHIPRFYRGTHATLEGVHTFRGRRLEAHPRSGTDPVQLEADGELVGHLPLTVEILPDAIQILRGTSC